MVAKLTGSKLEVQYIRWSNLACCSSQDGVVHENRLSAVEEETVRFKHATLRSLFELLQVDNLFERRLSFVKTQETF